MENKPNQPAAGGQQGQQNNMVMAILAYLGILIVVPFLTDAKNDPFVKYHIKQGLTLIIFEVATWFIGMVLVFMPYLGYLVGLVLWLATIVLIIIGIANAAQGKEQELPVIGQYAKRFNF